MAVRQASVSSALFTSPLRSISRAAQSLDLSQPAVSNALARLRQPRLDVTQVVLDGASGRVLAFGPGHVAGSALPGAHGNIVISGHRDTHFRWLRDLHDGDLLLLESDDGATRCYTVSGTAVHHESDVGLLDPLADEQLRLLTCYPFDGLYPGTPLRYVVTSRPLAM